MDDDNPYELEIAGASSRAIAAQIRSVVAAALRKHHVRSASISVALVNDAQIAELNRRCLGHPGPTDVLSFDLRDREGFPPGEAVDGEIFISIATAAREAVARGHSVDAEIALYAVHGTLHLLGYEDTSDADTRQMHEMEDEILSEAGIGRVYEKATRQ